MKMVKKILDYNNDGKVDGKDVKDIILRYQYNIILFGGLLLIILPVLNILDYIKLDSDLFWIVAGIVICAEVVLGQQKEKGENENEERNE